MKISMYCDDIRNFVDKIEIEEDPIKCINLSTEIIKICKSIVELATEVALKSDTQAELNI